MSLLQLSRDSQACEYNFANSGGAIGTYRLGLFIDENNLVDTMYFQPLVALNSGGLAQISFGGILAGSIFLPNIFVAPHAFGGPSFFIGPQFISQSLEVTMTITGAPLTAGRIMVIAEYFNTDF